MLESIQKKLYLEATRFELYTLLRYLLVKSVVDRLRVQNANAFE